MNYNVSRRLRDSRLGRDAKGGPAGTSRIVKALNQPITIFLLGTIIVGTGTSLFAEKRQCFAEWRALQANHNRLISEISFRASNMFEDGANEDVPREARLERTRLWLSPHASSLYREFAGEKLGSLFVRLNDLDGNLEMEQHLAGANLNYADEVPAGRFGPMPGYDEVYDPALPPTEEEVQGLRTLLSLREGAEDKVLDMIAGPQGQAVAAAEHLVDLVGQQRSDAATRRLRHWRDFRPALVPGSAELRDSVGP